MTAKYCVRLTQHLGAIINYCKDRSTEETTEHLRQDIEDIFAEKDTTFKDFKKDTEYRIELARKKHGEGIEYLDRVDKDLSNFKNYCDAMKLASLSDLFNEKVRANDLKNDNEQ